MKTSLYSPTICRSEMEAVLTRMVEERVGPGEVNKALSNAVADYFASSYAASFRSPPIALHYAVSALNIPPSSSVIISALSPYWVYMELKRDGFIPIIIDVAPDSFFMDIEKLKEKAKDAKANDEALKAAQSAAPANAGTTSLGDLLKASLNKN